MNNIVIDEKDQYKVIGLCGFYYKLFEEEEGGGDRGGLYRYPYLKHIIQLLPGDWEKQMSKNKYAVGMKNCVMVGGGGTQIVSPFRRQELWKCIGFFLSAVSYRKKGHKLWIEMPKKSGNMEPIKLQRDVRGKTDSYKVCCDLYLTSYIYPCH